LRGSIGVVSKIFDSAEKPIVGGLRSLAAVETGREDVFVNLIEVKKENWSFGNGEAQYAV
jgi:4-oxalocrotonate tautomerase